MVNFVNNLSLSLISVFGAVLYLFGQMSIGNISSFVLYSRKFSGPINEAANIISDLQSSIAAAERIFRLLRILSSFASELWLPARCGLKRHLPPAGFFKWSKSYVEIL